MRAVQKEWTKGTCDRQSRLHGGLGRRPDKITAVLRGKEKYLLYTSGGHTGAQVIQPSRLRIWASLQRYYRYWRSGDYISGKLWSPCTGDRGTKAQQWEIWSAEGLEAGSERRQASISNKTPASPQIQTHKCTWGEMHAEAHAHIGTQQQICS